jgi:serine/threonine protein kinase
MKQLALAVAYLHLRNVMHRDIKLENVVRSSQGLKLIDFGWSVHSIAQ